MRRSQGFTIIELLIAITIGLLVTLVVTQAYLSGLSTQQAQTGVSRAQEASRVAFDLLDNALRKAGYRNPQATGQSFCSQTSPISRIDLINDPASINPVSANLSGSSVSIMNSSDALRIRYYGEGLPTADGTIRDCQGNAVARNTVATDTFYVAADPDNDNEPALYCYSSISASSIALVPGIESMQLLYGDDYYAIGVVGRYVTGANVSSANQVRSAIISLIARTKERAAVDSSTRKINHFGTNYAASNTAPSGDAGSVFDTPTDGRIRQHTVLSVALRNVCPI